MTKRRNRLLNWFKKQYQLILYHGKNYDLLWKVKFNRIAFILLTLLMLIILFLLFYVLIAYTSIKERIPGYPSEETKLLTYENVIRTDSLVREIEQRDTYLQMLRDLIFNEIPIDEEFVVPTQNLNEELIKEFNDPTKPRRKIEDNTGYSINKSDIMPTLFPPLKGVVVSVYNGAKGHYGTDIASSGETTISATLNGTVLVADYTVENGYTVIIQHQQDLISVYKHNKSVLVKSGQYVEIGQPIAIYGDTGEYSTGQHLHFEIWKKGKSLNPEEYINFE